MKLAAYLFAGLFAMTTFADEWVPPEKPDVKAILNEARDDARSGNYKNALAKHVWFHENANELEPSMSGVRVSFALADWHELGKKYPPAMEKLKSVRIATRDRFLASIKDDKSSWLDFSDLKALNRKLQNDSDTVEVFKYVSEHNPKVAERIYGLAEDSLIGAKEYELCSKYIQPEKKVTRDLEIYKLERSHEVDPKYADRMKEYRDRRFIKDASTLVALLVINDRKEEAESAAVKYKTVEADADFHKKLTEALDNALKGELPSR